MQVFYVCTVAREPYSTIPIFQCGSSITLYPQVFWYNSVWLLLELHFLLCDSIDVKLIAWDIKGLNDKVKRSLLFKYLKSRKPHILFLQETHLMGSKILALKKSWVKQGFHATYSLYARGVAFLLNKSLPYSIGQVITNPGEQYIILILDLHVQCWPLVSVYIPPPV